MILTISGLAGSGTTTIAKLLASRLKLRLISAGAIFRRMAEENGMTLLEFTKFAETNYAIDKTLDKRLVEIARGGKVLLEGRLVGWLAQRNGLPSLRIWLDAPLEVRVKRIANRETKPYEQALQDIHTREDSEQHRYWNLYSIDLNDLSVYSLTIDTSHRTPQDVLNIIMTKILDLQSATPNRI